jgi:hypothetical protein
MAKKDLRRFIEQREERVAGGQQRSGRVLSNMNFISQALSNIPGSTSCKVGRSRILGTKIQKKEAILSTGWSAAEGSQCEPNNYYRQPLAA